MAETAKTMAGSAMLVIEEAEQSMIIHCASVSYVEITAMPAAVLPFGTLRERDLSKQAFPHMHPQTIKPPRDFQLCEGYACFAPVGSLSLKNAVELITFAIIFARDHQLKRLLVDATQLTGFPSPSLAERYWIARTWAEESRNAVELAVALQSHLIDPERFGVQVAINLGMRADVFEARLEALSWLLSGAEPYPLVLRD